MKKALEGFKRTKITILNVHTSATLQSSKDASVGLNS